MKNTLFRNALVTTASFVAVITVVSAWTAPTAAPTGGNAQAPITVSVDSQIKAGGLGVASLTTTGGASIGTNAGDDQLCLNGSCITAWPSGGGDNLGNHTATQNINMSGAQVTNIGAPVNATDVASKEYVDSKVAVGGPGTVIGGYWDSEIGGGESPEIWGVATLRQTCTSGTKRITSKTITMNSTFGLDGSLGFLCIR